MNRVGSETCLIPGRFQPFHNGHAAVLEDAASKYGRVVVAISQAHISHTDRDPFTGGERFEMIYGFVRHLGWLDRVVIIPVPVDDEPTVWVPIIQAICPPFDRVYTRSAWTKSLFEFWGVPNTDDLLDGYSIAASEVRALMATGSDWSSLVPESSAEVVHRCGGVTRVRQLLRGKNARLASGKPSP